MSKSNGWFSLFIRREFILGAFTLALFAILFATTNFRTFAGLQSYFRDVAYILVASVAMTMLFLTGNTDLSMGTTLGLAGFFAAQIAKSGAPWYFFMPVSIVVAVFFSGITGIVVTFFKVPSMVASLALMTIHMGLFTLLPKGGWVENMPRSFTDIGYAQVGGFLPLVFIAAIIVFAVCAWTMKYSPFSKKIYAVGGNRNAAILAGISPEKTIMITYLISGLLIGIAALLFYTNKQMVQANSSYGMEMVFITTTVVGGTSVNGGKGTLAGTAVGSFMFALLTRAMIFLGFQDYFSYAFQGFIIIIAVLATEIKFKPIKKLSKNSGLTKVSS